MSLRTFERIAQVGVLISLPARIIWVDCCQRTVSNVAVSANEGVTIVSRSTRMFEIIQLLRSANSPLTAHNIASELEVSKRTVYRDMATLQAMRVPVEGEAGLGYVMRPGYDLPPLNFTSDEIEAVIVGLAMLGRTGDAGLQSAARSVEQKIGTVLPNDRKQDLNDWSLYASDWNVMARPLVELGVLRDAIREENKLRLVYWDADDKRTNRTVLPVALVYYIEVIVLAAWCELRFNYRHFRVDRIADCTLAEARFAGEGKVLRTRWREQYMDRNGPE